MRMVATTNLDMGHVFSVHISNKRLFLGAFSFVVTVKTCSSEEEGIFTRIYKWIISEQYEKKVVCLDSLTQVHGDQFCLA